MTEFTLSYDWYFKTRNPQKTTFRADNKKKAIKKLIRHLEKWGISTEGLIIINIEKKVIW